MKKIFIVGVARSGTTLLQSILGNHPDIYTLPESHFFSQTIPKEKILRFTHKINFEHKTIIKNFLQNENQSDIYKEYKGNALSINQWTKYILSILHEMGKFNGKEIILEKTPQHIYYIDLIEKNCNNCFFIHIIREPLANIAALYYVSNKYPESFLQNTIKKAIDRYKKEILLSEKCLNRSNHFFVHYEELVNFPEKNIKQLCDSLKIKYTGDILNYQESVDQIVSKDEKWKKNNKNSLNIKSNVKERITEVQIKEIKKSFEGFNIKLLKYYEKN